MAFKSPIWPYVYMYRTCYVNGTFQTSPRQRRSSLPNQQLLRTPGLRVSPPNVEVVDEDHLQTREQCKSKTPPSTKHKKSHWKRICAVVQLSGYVNKKTSGSAYGQSMYNTMREVKNRFKTIFCHQSNPVGGMRCHSLSMRAFVWCIFAEIHWCLYEIVHVSFLT